MSDNIYYVWVILKELIKIQIYVITRFISIFGFMPDLINRLYCSAEEIVIKTSKIINGMAKVQIKSERITPFGGFFQVRALAKLKIYAKIIYG